MRQKYFFTCLYCGNQWIDESYYQPTRFDQHSCKICKEKYLIKVQQAATSDIFGYRFSPDFPEISGYYGDDDLSQYFNNLVSTDEN